MKRSILLRVEQPASAMELQRRSTRAIQAGFDGIELAVGTAASGGTETGPAATPSVTVETIGPELSIGAVAAGVLATDVETALPTITALLHEAATCQARCLCITIPPVRRRPEDDGFPRYQDGLNFAYALLHRARHEAETAGVPIALEVATNGCLLSPVELREIIDSANSWAVGACIDARRVLGTVPPQDWVTTLTHRVHAVRLRDLAAGASSGHTSPNAIFDVAGLSAALDEIGYERTVIASGTEDPAILRRHLAKHEQPE
jgi:hexulose-6-phosphate isomerase